MPTNKTILETLRTMRPKDFMYPGIFLGFVILLGIIFYNATNFISVNINKVFSSQQNADSQALDLVRYTLVAKKLNIPVITPPEIDVESEGVPLGETTATPTISSDTIDTASTTPTLDKKSLTITVANSTTKKGLAGMLAKELTEAGFSAPKTSTQTKLIATTTILIHNQKLDYAPILLETVLKSYPQAVVATTTESSSADALIIIGTN